MYTPWNLVYSRSFHQIRFLSLWALIFVHAVSFVNNVVRIPLENKFYYPVLLFISHFGTCFVVLAGVGMAVALRPYIQKGRLVEWPRNGLLTYLFVLTVLDEAKKVWVYNDVTTLYQWDFLKTLLLSYLLILLVARLHLVVLAALSLAVPIFGTGLQAFLVNQMASEVQVASDFSVWNAVHIQIFILALVSAGLFLSWIWTQTRFAKAIRLLITLAAVLGLAHLALQLTEYRPSLFVHLAFRNWLLDGLAGHSQTMHLYPGLAWIPTILNAFLISLMGFRFRAEFERHSLAVFWSSAVLAVGAYFLSLQQAPAAQDLIWLWEIPGARQISILTEFSKAASMTNLFLLFVILNRRYSAAGIERPVVAFSRASFPVYLVFTTLTAMVAPYLGWRFGLWGGTLICFCVTAVVCLIVTVMADFAHRKSFRLTLIAQGRAVR